MIVSYSKNDLICLLWIIKFVVKSEKNYKIQSNNTLSILHYLQNCAIFSVKTNKKVKLVFKVKMQINLKDSDIN